MADNRRMWQLDALSGAAARIESMKRDGIDANVIRRNQIDLIHQAALFLRSIVGETIIIPFDPDRYEVTSYIVHTLNAWMPVIRGSDIDSDTLWGELLSDIQAIPWGDEPTVLRRFSRAQGQHRQPMKLAKARLSALCWEKHLRSKGVPPSMAQEVLAQLFGVDRDAMRKWRQSVTATLGKPYVDTKLEQAESIAPLGLVDHGDGDNLVEHATIYRTLVGLSLPSRELSQALLEKVGLLFSIPPED